MVLNELKLYSAKYNDEEFTSESHLNNAFLTKSEFLSPVVTFMYGGGSKDFSSYNFPLLFATEGMGRTAKKVQIDSADLSFKMGVLGSPKETSTISRTLYSSSDTPGKGMATFKVPFKDRHFYKGQSVYTPSKIECRIYDNPKQDTGGGWIYEMVIVTSNASKYIPASDLLANVKWGGGIVKVAKSHSRGTETRSYTPYATQNQLSVVRKSYPIAGNMANKIMVMEFKIDGTPYKYWSQWELFLTRKMFMMEQEHDLFHSTYNKDSHGVIHTIDADNGGVVTSAAGLLQQITNSMTYAKMTGRYLRTMMNDLFFHANGTEPVNIVAYTGTGGMDEVSEALKDDVLSSFNITTEGSGAMTKGSDGYYSAGGPYFNKLIHREGHTFTFQYHPMMDRGPIAKASAKHPVTGWPMESYNFYAVDHSMVEGQPNVQYVSERGREQIEKIVQGMAKVPMGNDSMFASSDIDASSIEWMKTQAPALRRPTNCAKIFCDIS